MFVGLLGLRRFPSSSPLARACYYCLTVIGIGSFLLHATLEFWGELIDEVAMLWLVALFELMLGRALCSPRIFRFLTGLVIFLNMAILSQYISYNNYEVFLHGFTLQIVAVVVLPAFVRFNVMKSNPAIMMSLLSKMPVYKASVLHIIFARFIWELVSFRLLLYMRCASAYVRKKSKRECGMCFAVSILGRNMCARKLFL